MSRGGKQLYILTLLLYNHVVSYCKMNIPYRYKFYRMLFNNFPTPIVDWLTVIFCDMPTYQRVTAASRNASSTNGSYLETAEKN